MSPLPWPTPRPSLIVVLVLMLSGAGLLREAVYGQTNPEAQRNALNSVRSQVSWLQNASRTASSYNTGGYGLVWQQFQSLCAAYAGFKSTLSPQQRAAGANELAELDAGLGIIQECFTNAQQDMAEGRSERAAVASMCRVLDRAIGLWLQEMDKNAGRLRVGWG